MLNGIPCCADECAEDVVSEQDQKAGESHPDDACSPFLSCGGCAGFVTFETEDVLPAVKKVIRKELAADTEGTCSDFIRDIWEPPQFINA